MKDGGFRKASRPISSHLIKPVLNGLSDLLRLPQYPVLGVRAAASTGVRREGELYTHAQAEGKRGRGAPSDAHKSGDNRSLGAFPHCGGSPRRQPRPNGQVPPVCQDPHVPCRPRRRVRPPHTQAPRLASQRGRPRDRLSFLMHRGPRSPSPPLSPCKPAEPLCIHQEPGPGRRAGHTRRRARPLPNATARNVSAHHGQDCDTADMTD